MELIITIDDKVLPLIRRAYGIGSDSVEMAMDEKAQETELISRIQERLYSAIHFLKQQDASNVVGKSSELTVALKL
jgi:hypothetical protein